MEGLVQCRVNDESPFGCAAIGLSVGGSNAIEDQFTAVCGATSSSQEQKKGSGRKKLHNADVPRLRCEIKFLNEI